MLDNLSLQELLKLYQIVNTAVALRNAPALLLNQIQALHRLNTQAVIEGRTSDQSLVTALLVILEHQDCYGLAGSNPPLISAVLKQVLGDRPILSITDRGNKLAVDLGL